MNTTTTRNTEGRLLSGFLNMVEKAGNKLPEPALIFFYMLMGVYMKKKLQ